MCDAQLEREDSLKKHKTEVHEHNKILVDKTFIDNILAENDKVKAELANLKDDFERLHTIFKDTLETLLRIKIETMILN